MTKIAILHGNYFSPGGGERVAEAIAKTFDAPLYYGFGNKDAIPENGVTHHKLFEPNAVGHKLVRKVHQYRDFHFMWNGMHVPELFDYDIVIQSGNEFGWYVPKQMNQTIVKYVHSPPRGPYDMHYKHGSSRFHRAYALAAKALYGHTTDYVDSYIANSEVVAKRAQKAWGVDSEIVYPPVDVDNYGPEYAEQDRDKTYLTFSRLYRHKRTREIVNAFTGRDAKLIVGGDGPQREKLTDLAPANVDIRGYLSESEKRRLLAEVDALIFNAENEDFGIVPIEAFASGTPVIGIQDGFTQHQIREGKNGYTYPEGNPAQIAAALSRFQADGVDWSTSEIQEYANQFSTDRFRSELRELVAQAHENGQIEPKCNG